MKSPFKEVVDVEGKIALGAFLRMRLSRSGKEIKRAIDAGACFVNNRSEKFASYSLKRGDAVLFYLDRFEKPKRERPKVLFEDPYFTAWDKPPFFVCDEGFLLHRLDKETSGVILTSNEKGFFDLFRNREIEKIYLAVVEGIMEKKSGSIENELDVIKRFEGQKMMGIVHSKGMYAKTDWRVLAEKDSISLVECRPKTGRTHQIRVHMSSLKHPIIGDHQYGQRFSHRANRMLLHAHKLRFTHPVTKKNIEIVSPPPIQIRELFGEDLFR